MHIIEVTHEPSITFNGPDASGDSDDCNAGRPADDHPHTVP